jgi:hypothetical protein
MTDVLYLCYDCIDFHFACTVLCAFTRMFVLCFTFSYLHYVCLCFPPSSRFSALLRVLVNPFIAIQELHTHLFVILGTMHVCAGVFAYRIATILR